MIDFTKLFENEFQRMARSMSVMDPSSAAYGQLLSNMSDLVYLAHRLGAATQENPDVIDVTPAHVKKAVAEDLGLDTPEEPAAEIVPEPVSGPTPETGRSYTKEEVRAALAESRKRGVKVTELLGELGYDNFSAVPAGEYGEVMAKLGEA